MCKTLIPWRYIFSNFRVSSSDLELDMRLVIKKLLITSAPLLLLMSCGNNNKANPATTASAASPKYSSKPFDPAALLKYDPKDADKRIDQFFHKLHEKSAFNGNILVAKHGKIIWKRSAGPTPPTTSLKITPINWHRHQNLLCHYAINGRVKLNQDVKDFSRISLWWRDY